jgi:ferric-dicitrate binding protein FerR (iron transport regulator)
MSIERNEPHPDDAGIEELLRSVGAREEPSAELRRDIETAVHTEWQGMLAQRRRRYRSEVWAYAASFVIAVTVGFIGVRSMRPDSVQVATVARIEGHVRTALNNGTWTALGAGQAVTVGETLLTDDRSRAAFAFADGISVRLDRNTTLRLAGADRIVLDSGAVYVDSPPGATATLTVQTRAGSIRHIGTQYQVRTYADAIEIGIREGRVLLRNDAGTNAGAAGERLQVTTRGDIIRTPMSAQDPQWQWAAEAAPRFDINDQTLATFLAWLARQTGRRVSYASSQTEAAAQAVKLRGSIDGLDLETALTAVLSTTQLRRYETEPDSIGIALDASIDSDSAARPTL